MRTKGKSIPALESPRQGRPSAASCSGPFGTALPPPHLQGAAEAGGGAYSVCKTKSRVAKAARKAVLLSVASDALSGIFPSLSEGSLLPSASNIFFHGQCLGKASRAMFTEAKGL